MSGCISIACVATLTLVVAGCSPPSQPPLTAVPAASTNSPANPDHQAIVVARAQDTAAKGDLVVNGPVTVEQQLDIVALRAGVIVTLNADVDTAVQKGQVLTTLDDRQLTADRSAAEHKVKSLESDLKNWQEEVEVRTSDLRRAEAMHKEGINTQEAYDHSRYELTAAKYEVERQREEMLSAEATVNSLDLELEKTRYLAPFNGVVSERHVRLGQYVTVGDKLFHLTGASPLEVRFTLPGVEIARLKRGDVVAVAPAGGFDRSTPSSTATASVTHVSPVIDPGSDSVEVTAVLNGKVPGLSSGSIASIRIPKSQ